MKGILLPLILILSISSCRDEITDPGNLYITSNAKVKEVNLPDEVSLNTPFEIGLVVYGNDYCYEFNDYDYFQDLDTIEVHLTNKKMYKSICLQAIIEIDTVISLSIPEPGRKYIKFQASENFDYDFILIDSVIVR